MPEVKTYVVYSFNEAEIIRESHEGIQPTAVELLDHAVDAMQEYYVAVFRSEDADCREDGPFTCRLHTRNTFGSLKCRRSGEPQLWYRVAAIDQKNNPGPLSRAVPAPACNP